MVNKERREERISEIEERKRRGEERKRLTFNEMSRS